MTPPLIVLRARQRGLRVLGVVDHNSAGNARAAMEASAGSGIVVKPGLEVETQESVHLVCLFDTAEQALSMQERVYACLPPLPPPIGGRSFGQQSLLDRDGECCGYESRPLFASIQLPAADVARGARAEGGLVIAAHVERRAYGLLGVLGFVPADLLLDAMECGPGGLASGRLASSDAHRLTEIGSRYTILDASGASVAELRECLAASAFRVGCAL
jgi:hypothetical protein